MGATQLFAPVYELSETNRLSCVPLLTPMPNLHTVRRSKHNSNDVSCSSCLNTCHAPKPCLTAISKAFRNKFPASTHASPNVPKRSEGGRCQKTTQNVIAYKIITSLKNNTLDSGSTSDTGSSKEMSQNHPEGLRRKTLTRVSHESLMRVSLS